MKYPKKHARHFVRHTRLPLGQGLLVAIAFVICAYAGIQLLRAAGHIVSNEAESGTIAGNAIKRNDSTASNGQTVLFGGTTPVPVNIEAVTGGNNLVLLWDAPADNIVSYDVYRDGTKVTNVRVGAGTLKSDRQGTRYVDNNITRGTTYRYQVRAISSAGIQSALSSQISATPPTGGTPIPNVVIDAPGAAADTAAFLRDYMKPEVETWYPKIANAIAYPDYTPFNGTITLFSDPTYTGPLEVSSAHPGRIRIGPHMMRGAGMSNGIEGGVLHEATHIIQGYDGSSSPQKWVTEGIADWAREWFMRERYKVKTAPLSVDLDIGTAQASYVVEWGKRYDPDFPRTLNVAVKKGDYDSNFIPNIANGKTDNQLHTEMRNEYYRPNGEMKGIGGKCFDVASGNPADQTKLQLYTCNGLNPQKMRRVYKDTGLNAGLEGRTKKWFLLMNSSIGVVDGKCVDVKNAGTASGTIVWLWGCDLGGINTAQMWMDGPNGSIINPRSGKCLSTTNGGSEDGNQLIIADCNGSASQRWTLPD